MKRNLFTKSIVVSVALSALLTGCGTAVSDEDNNNDGANTLTQTSISGKAIDGYLQNAVVCLDLNDDGYCQANDEPITTTLADGSFKLNITQTQRDNEKFDEAMLLIFGGVDVDTGKDFRGKLMAPNDGSSVLNVSPITTLVAKNVQKALKAEKNLSKKLIKEKIKEARQKVADALEIEEGEIGLDPVEEKNSGNDKLIRKALKLQKSIEAQLIAAKVKDKDIKEKIEDMYEALAEGIDGMQTGERGLDKLYERASQRDIFKETLKGQDIQEMLRIADKISENLDIAFENIEDDDLEKIAAITRDNFEDIRKGANSGDLSSAIDGIVFLPEDDRFQPDFDWLETYIVQDLLELGIEPTPALIAQLKPLFRDEVKAGVLLHKAERLKKSSDAKLRAIYKRIELIKEKAEQDKEAEKARFDKRVKADIKSFLSGQTLYVVDQDDFDYRGDYTFSYTMTELSFNDDATVVSVSEEDETNDYQLKIRGNNIFVFDESGEEKEDVLTFKIQTPDFYEFYSHDGEHVRLYKDASKAELFIESMKKIFDDLKELLPQKDQSVQVPENTQPSQEVSPL